MRNAFRRRCARLAALLWAMAAFLPFVQGVRAQSDHFNLEKGLPARVEDAYPTGYRNREVQFFSTYERTGDSKDRVLLQPVIEFGFARNWQGKVTAPFRLGSADKIGSGDIEFEAMYNFNTEGLRIPAISLAGSAHAPSGRDSAGLDTTAKILVTQSISNRLDRLHFNLELTRNAAPREEERSTRYAAVVGYSTRLGPDTIFVADFVREQERKYGENANIAEIGFRRQLTPLVILSFGVGAGIGAESPKFRAAFGIQRSLDF